MTFSDYLSKLRRLSEVKILILKVLWGDEADPFPKPWIKSSTLLHLTKQKYFDRRTRELHDENGCDIDQKSVGGEHCYRLSSDSVQTSNPRFYLNAKAKAELFRTAGNKCQVCGKRMGAGVKGLQADHRKPLIRGGSHGAENWQAICNECNVGKKRACAGCEDDCLRCPWAFPDEVGILTILRIPTALREAIELRAGSDNQEAIEAEIVRILGTFLNLD